MVEVLIVTSFIVSFLISLFFMPMWIRKAREIHLMWDDINKIRAPKVAGSGGIITVLAFIVGIFMFIAYRTFYLHTHTYMVEMFALVTVVLLLTGIGLVDDLLGWRRGGLSKRSRLLLVLLSAIPLIVINAGKSQIAIPLLGTIDSGLAYPLLIIPLGILGAATSFNFLAGLNGLEAGQGIILLAGLSFVAVFTGNAWLAVVAGCMIAALIGFLIYNTFPAKIFPGDSLTYAVGGLIAIIPILGNFERIAVFFFSLYFVEIVLKSRGKLQKYSFGKPTEDGFLDLRYDKLYSINHAAIYLLNKSGIRATERRAVYLIWAVQLLIIVVGVYLFREGIFLL